MTDWTPRRRLLGLIYDYERRAHTPPVALWRAWRQARTWPDWNRGN